MLLLKDHLKLDSKTYQLISLHDRGVIKANDIIYGSTHRDGYKSFSLYSKTLYVHRVVWELLHGEIPDGYEIDHIDRDRGNNHPDNLRLASKADNMRYRQLQPKDNGLPIGVSEYKGGYRAIIKYHGKRSSKVCVSIREAEEWLKHKRIQLHGIFSRDL